MTQHALLVIHACDTLTDIPFYIQRSGDSAPEGPDKPTEELIGG